MQSSAVAGFQRSTCVVGFSDFTTGDSGVRDAHVGKAIQSTEWAPDAVLRVVKRNINNTP